MWLVHKETGKNGWHICQQNIKQQADLLVFVRAGGAWRTEMWCSDKTAIRPKNYAEEKVDDAEMLRQGFWMGSSNQPIKY